MHCVRCGVKLDAVVCDKCGFHHGKTAVILLEGVTSLHVDAFCDCPALQTVVIPDTLTFFMYGSPFRNCPYLVNIVASREWKKRRPDLLEKLIAKS